MTVGLASRAPSPASQLRHLLIADSADAGERPADIVVWLGEGEVPNDLARGRSAVVPSTRRAAALYVASAPARFSLALADPVEFMELLVEVRDAPALRAV